MSTIAITNLVPRKRGVDRDARSMLLALGVGNYNATMLIQSMFLMPRTTPPTAQATMLIVQALQKGLKQIGAPVQPNGMLDSATRDALVHTSGYLWMNKTWVQIMGDLLDAIEGKKKFPGSAPVATGEYMSMSDMFDVSPTTISVGAAAIGLALLYISMRD